MKRCFPVTVRQCLTAGGIFLFTMGMSSCQSTAPAGDAGYRPADPITPIDRASFMQERIGQVQRSFIR